MVGMWAVNMVAWERSSGTLPLLAAGPTNPAVVLASRGAYLIADGTLSATGALLVTGCLFGLPMPWPDVLLVPPLIALVAVSAYCFGTFAGGLLLGYRSIETIVTNVGVVLLMTLCGVNVPMDAYPGWLRPVSDVLPLTHGLTAIRLTLAGDLSSAGVQAVWEALVGAGWLSVSLLTFTAIVRRGRRLGTLDYAA
jgi:ABC-2 type transport system permease protein